MESKTYKPRSHHLQSHTPSSYILPTMNFLNYALFIYSFQFQMITMISTIKLIILILIFFCISEQNRSTAKNIAAPYHVLHGSSSTALIVNGFDLSPIALRIDCWFLKIFILTQCGRWHQLYATRNSYRTTTTTTTILQPFIWDYLGELVPEETFAHSHLLWSSTIPYQLPPSTIIYSILHSMGP